MKSMQNPHAGKVVLTGTSAHSQSGTKRKKKSHLASMSIAIVLLLSFLNAVYYLHSSHQLVDVYADEEQKEPLVSQSDVYSEDVNPEASPEMVFVPEENYSRKKFSLYPDGTSSDKTVTLDGIMPEGASAQAVDVTKNYSDPDDVRTNDTSNASGAEASVIAAYHITITDGEEEFEPAEDCPIRVIIADPQISTEGITEVWHIKDNGEREQIIDFTILEGKLSFYAAGFSVYAIVNAPDPYVRPDLESVTSLDDLTGSRAEKGFYLYYTYSNANTTTTTNKYFTSYLNDNNALIETTSIDKAAIWFFEQENANYRIYTYVDSQKVYIHNKSANNVELISTAYDKLTITQIPDKNAFYFKKADKNMWLQHSNGGVGIRYWTDNNNAVNSQLGILFADNCTPPDDYYGLAGKSYGLMNYTSGTIGNALMANEGNNHLEMLSMVVRSETSHDTLYVAEDSQISMWTFHLISGTKYKLSTVVNGVTRYLKIGNSLTLTDQAQASEINVTSLNGKIMLWDNNRAISYSDGGFTVDKDDPSKVNQWLSLVTPSGMAETDYVTYSSEKISVSDVPDGSSVIIYTRVWNDDAKSYDFYAINHNGTLYPCYERGNNIMWVGNQINTLLWNLIEYHYDDGSPNYYYELYNPYSRKFIAPQIKDGQILSDSKIGINLPGRRDNQYYTDILAWDDAYYTFAGLKSDIAAKKVIPDHAADTFYFARIDAPVKTLTKVGTIDNDDYGITLKMIDYINSENQNLVLGDKKNTRNLLSTNLSADPDDKGYPTALLTNQSLKTLFENAETVNHLFIESIYNASGYFEFDSCQNFATLRNESGDVTHNFTVYKELGTTDREPKTTLKHGQFFPYDSITAGVYSTENPENLYSASAIPGEEATGLLSDDDPRKFEKLHSVGKNPNYYNGMEMGARFVQTPSGKDSWGHDIIFEFKGDDDFWLYVDDELVIDLGGIHSALAGNVNFATGSVIVEGKKTTLRALFESNYRTRNPNATQEEVTAFLKGYFNDNENIFKDYSSHTMKVFYMERGAGASNLHMRFNLSYITPGHVMLTKSVTGSDNVDYNLVEYPYQIWYKDEAEGDEHLLRNDDEIISVTYQNSTKLVHYQDSYTPPNSTKSYDSVYFLNPGKSAEIHFPANTIEYKVIECGVNTEVYQKVLVNGQEITGESDGNVGRKEYQSGWISVSERPTVVFENQVDPDALRTLSIQKKLFDETGKALYDTEDATTFSYRLSLSNGSDDTLKLANMYRYYVMDPGGYYCRWDADLQKFVSIGKTDFSLLSSEEKRSVTFETSMNGSISKIPAWYTVAVPSLAVGTKFKVEERDYEIPLGYKLLGYQPEPGTYIIDTEAGQNTGWVRAKESPKIYVSNQRGWELKADKIWSDQDFTSSHTPIYTAVYIGNQLIEGTVRRLNSPDTSVRYFFDDLQNGKNIDDYEIREVEVVGPVFEDNSDTVTGYQSIHPLSENENTQIGSTPKDSQTVSEHVYTVNYQQGTASKTAENVQSPGNVRTDTITNTRFDGVVITLYDMKSKLPLQGGQFTLQHDNKTLGTFTSDAHGKITVLYDCKRGEDYTLTQTVPPDSYIGLPYSTVFSIGADHSVTVSGNEDVWEDGRASNGDGTAIIAYIDVFNKPFTLQAVKISTRTNAPVGGAHFALYRTVKSVTGQIKDYAPMTGYSDLVCDESGVIPKIDSSLEPGTYYLTETQPPADYEGISEDVVFTISSLGSVTIESDNQDSNLYVSSAEEENAYVINVLNQLKYSPVELTVTKTVRDSAGGNEQSFTFTLHVEGATAGETYEWSKNDTEQSEPLRSGDSFTLKDKEYVTITLPKNVNITVTEESDGYDTTFQLGDAPTEETVSKTFILTGDETLGVVNMRNTLVASGIKTHVVWAAVLLLTGLAGTGLIFMRRRKEV